MEEQFMFSRIHDALDIATPPGAYERLRTNLTKKPVRPMRWPALQMRTSTMGFRLTAGLVVVAIAVAAAAAAVAIHNSTSNLSPAGSRMSIQAYQKMIAADSPDPNVVWNLPCDDTVHTGCESDATRSLPLIQKWLKDLQGARTPVRFAVVDAEMRHHLEQNIGALNALIADSRAHDDKAMTRDYVVAVYAVAWTGTVVPQIAKSQQVTETGYRNIVAAFRQHAIDVCLASCTLFASKDAESCTTNGGVSCYSLFDEAASNFALFSGTLVQDAAPPSLSTLDTHLENDLAAADDIFLTMRVAVASGDQAGINAGISQLRRATVAIERDAAAITG